ncbi:Mariner Mos1 transposase [Eumeta japonica]|uniref:Mariner Mos1 transposase n=1 Tax=Eumeta variegata TaxID=151549 RepID=A0A4C1VKR1_EUMVA|nr:Mariner Mos1 transposase [Eumeta japonica]
MAVEEKVFEDAELEALLDQDLCQTQQELHDNARPPCCKVVKTYSEMLKWEVLPYLPYSPDVAPADYHLFSINGTRPG